jgi:DNA-binding response OmpR family regulator
MGIAALKTVSGDELRGVHVLLVEDTDDTRELLREALQYCGALVTTAASKKEAERLLRDLKPHVIVSDIAMPDDGIALLRHVMEIANDRGTNVPVIAISAERHHPVDLVGAGFVEFVPKPLDPIALCEQIRAHVRPAA